MVYRGVSYKLHKLLWKSRRLPTQVKSIIIVLLHDAYQVIE